MQDLMTFIISAIIVGTAGWMCIQTIQLVEEKKDRQRKGLTDYYDNPIKKKCMGGEDEEVQ